MTLSVLNELRYFLPVTTPKQDEELTKDLLANGGPRDAIKVWKGKNFILDGHRRYAICEKYNLPFRIVEIDPGPELLDAQRWMANDQLQRRNVSDHDQAILRVAVLNLEREICQPGAVARTAEASGVTVRTISRDQLYVKALDSLPADIRDWISRAHCTRKDVVDFAKLPEEGQRAIMSIVDARQKTMQQALYGEDDSPAGPADYDDSESPSAPKRPPQPKPAAERFRDMERLIGSLVRHADELNDELEGCDVLYNRIHQALNTILMAVQAWRERVAE